MKLGVKQVVLGLIALTVGACSVLPEAEEIQIYHLPIGAPKHGLVGRMCLGSICKIVLPNELGNPFFTTNN